MVLSPLLQVAAVVTSAVEPSEYVPIAFSGVEVPLASDTGDGDTARASWSPRLRYCRGNMSRSERLSSCWLVPACGMHVPA